MAFTPYLTLSIFTKFQWAFLLYTLHFSGAKCQLGVGLVGGRNQQHSGLHKIVNVDEPQEVRNAPTQVHHPGAVHLHHEEGGEGGWEVVAGVQGQKDDEMVLFQPPPTQTERNVQIQQRSETRWCLDTHSCCNHAEVILFHLLL